MITVPITQEGRRQEPARIFGEEVKSLARAEQKCGGGHVDPFSVKGQSDRPKLCAPESTEKLTTEKPTHGKLYSLHEGPTIPDENDAGV